MIKDKLAIAAQVTRKSGPWVGLVTSALIIAADLKKNRQS